jgi:hypothetical protein
MKILCSTLSLRSLSALLIGGSLLPSLSLSARGGAAVLEFQKAPAVAGPWQSLPANQLSITPDGKLSDDAGSSSFYRLKISTSDVAGGPLSLPLSAVPLQALQMATDMLNGNPGGLWNNAALASYVYPVYNPAIFGGTSPAYLEFKVVAAPPPGVTNPPPPSVSPSEASSDKGFILVSLSTQDVPIPEMASDGPTRVEQLRKAAGSSTVRAVRYSAGFLAAEDAQGNLAASLGSAPSKLPAELISLYGNTFQGQVVSNNVVVDPGKPTFSPQPYATYADYRNDYLTGPVYSYLRARQAETGQFRWNLALGQMPTQLNIPIGQTNVVLPGQPIVAFDLENPDLASGQVIPGGGGLSLVGLTMGGTFLHVLRSDSTTAYYALIVGSPPGTKGWSAWQCWWAGSCSDERHYDQVWNLTGGCNAGCWSGCGPTAWAMFYGWWDQRGPCSLIGDCGATPLWNNDDVLACLRAECGFLGTWCAFGSGATSPWNMHEGYRWAGTRGRAISSTWSWCVPHFGSGPRNLAIAAIKNGRPACVGIGFYEHYPLAWGYAYSENTWAGITWATANYWYANMGHGSSSCGQWVNADSCWFGHNAWCW